MTMPKKKMLSGLPTNKIVIPPSHPSKPKSLKPQPPSNNSNKPLLKTKKSYLKPKKILNKPNKIMMKPSKPLKSELLKDKPLTKNGPMKITI